MLCEEELSKSTEAINASVSRMLRIETEVKVLCDADYPMDDLLRAVCLTVLLGEHNARTKNNMQDREAAKQRTIQHSYQAITGDEGGFIDKAKSFFKAIGSKIKILLLTRF